MIVELFGSPGAGKTYAINLLKPGSIKEDTKRRDYVADAVKGVVKVLLLAMPLAFDIRKAIRNNIKDISDPDPFPRFKPVKIRTYINNISMLGCVYRYSPNDIYMDEGIVHRVISMCINYGIGKEICVRIIHELYYLVSDVRVIFLYYPREECLKSIISRNRHSCSIDELRGDKLDAFLGFYEDYCQYVCNHFGFEKMDRSEIAMLEIS